MIGVLLDEHVSGPVIGSALAEYGLDVRAADSDNSLTGASDGELLVVARLERRVLVTNNIKHFSPLTRELAARGEGHHGLIFIPHNIRTSDFGLVISQLRVLLVGSTPDEWWNRVEWTRRRSP